MRVTVFDKMLVALSAVLLVSSLSLGDIIYMQVTNGKYYTYGGDGQLASSDAIAGIFKMELTTQGIIFSNVDLRRVAADCDYALMLPKVATWASADSFTGYINCPDCPTPYGNYTVNASMNGLFSTDHTTVHIAESLLLGGADFPRHNIDFNATQIPLPPTAFLMLAGAVIIRPRK